MKCPFEIFSGYVSQVTMNIRCSLSFFFTLQFDNITKIIEWMSFGLVFYDPMSSCFVLLDDYICNIQLEKVRFLLLELQLTHFSSSFFVLFFCRNRCVCALSHQKFVRHRLIFLPTSVPSVCSIKLNSTGLYLFVQVCQWVIIFEQRFQSQMMKAFSSYLIFKSRDVACDVDNI